MLACGFLHEVEAFSALLAEPLLTEGTPLLFAAQGSRSVQKAAKASSLGECLRKGKNERTGVHLEGLPDVEEDGALDLLGERKHWTGQPETHSEAGGDL